MSNNQVGNVLESVWHQIVTSPTPSMSVVVLMVSFLLCFFLLRLIVRRHRIRISRNNIPFVIGGWGTRGKSGTERKKAALFEGLGYHVTGKTTGCEAMMIHARPGQEGVELPIYRPGDKATIWEQGNVVRWASQFKTQVFLWECMALGSDYAATLQHDWMNDDLSTLSNTFVDHENVQGPTGMDVTKALTSFIPYDSHLFTAEELMQPVIKNISRQRGTRVHSLSWDESDLIGDDVLKQFPYTVHPRNLGMVLKMAKHLEIDENVALREIARNIIPDLGSFKSYHTRFRNRYLEFWNGMSANDRISTTGNWQSAGFDTIKPGGNTWCMTVVNNRDDRIIRSREFSEIIVNDTPANLHILIGTNLTGLQGYIIEAVKEYAESNYLVGPNTNPTIEPKLLDRLKQYAMDFFKHIRVDAVTYEMLMEKCTSMLNKKIPVETIDSLLKTLISKNSTDLKIIRNELDKHGIESKYISEIALLISRDIKDLSLITEFFDFLEEETVTRADSFSPTAVNSRFHETLINLYKNRIVILSNPFLSGDQIVNEITKLTPPNFTIKIMGMQNIKGAGLDFAYRWVSLDNVQSAISKLESDSSETRRKGLEFLIDYDNYGILDSQLAIDALKHYRKQVVREMPEIVAQLDDAIVAIQKKYEIRQSELRSESRTHGFQRMVWWILEQIREAGDSKRRRRQINQVMDDLFNQRISHVKARNVLHDIKKRQEGGWMH